MAFSANLCVHKAKVLVVAPNNFAGHVLSNKVEQRGNAVVGGKCRPNLCACTVDVHGNADVLWLHAEYGADLAGEVDLPLHELHVAV